MKTFMVVLAIGLVAMAAVGDAATAPTEQLPYRADRYCIETAQVAIVFFNQRVAGADEKSLDDALTRMLAGDFARAAILKAAIRRMYHGSNRLRTRREVIDYTYHYCMDTPTPAATAPSR